MRVLGRIGVLNCEDPVRVRCKVQEAEDKGDRELGNRDWTGCLPSLHCGFRRLLRWISVVGRIESSSMT